MYKIKYLKSNLKPYSIITSILFGVAIYMYFSHVEGKTYSSINSGPITKFIREHDGLPDNIVAPLFELQTTEKNTVRLQDYLGKIKGILFISSTCPHCKILVQEMTTSIDLSNQPIWIIIIDNAVGAFNIVKEYQPSFPVLIDSLNIVSKTYNIKRIPRLYVIDTNGRIDTSIVGASDIWKMIEKW